MDWTLALTLFAVSLGAAIAGLGITALWDSRRSRADGGIFAESTDQIIFIFDDESLVDATVGARQLISAVPSAGTAWDRFMTFAAPRFSGLQEAVSSLESCGRVVLDGTGPTPIRFVAEWRGGLKRISLSDPQHPLPDGYLDSFPARVQVDELKTLDMIVNNVALPIWREDEKGSIVWANEAYQVLADPACEGASTPIWPLPHVFDRQVDDGRRAAIKNALTGETRWFSLHRRITGEGSLRFAIPIDDAIQAERTLRDFIQTLGKTFAHLPIGLAVFDRQRRLSMFNPALTDLTTLPVDLLSARPTLGGFLDAMRNRRMIPEPKDYKNWRQRIAALEASATEESQETWSLPSGLTYRVTCRPHPEGALALLIEDISAEVSATRSYRADLALGQSVIDAMDEAIVVFSSAGQIVLANEAYQNLWGPGPDPALKPQTVHDAIERWRRGTSPDPVWQRVAEYLTARDDRVKWAATARLADGRLLQFRLTPLTGGAFSVRFEIVAPDSTSMMDGSGQRTTDTASSITAL